MNGNQWPLDDLIVNTEANMEGQPSLTKNEIFILGWLIFNTISGLREPYYKQDSALAIS